MITKNLRHKFNVAVTEARYRLYNLTRPRANAAVRRLALSRPLRGEGAVLYEALWDHPYHWLRLALFRNALADEVGEFMCVYEQGTPKRILESMRALAPVQEHMVPTDIEPKFRQQADELMKGVSSRRDFLDLELPYGYPAYQVYDGILKKQLQGTLDIHDPFTTESLAQSLQYLDYYGKLLAAHTIKKVIVSHPSFPRFSTLVWMALHHGIEVISTIHVNEQIGARKLSKISDYQGFLSDYPPLITKDLASTQLMEHLAQRGREYYAQVRSGTASDFAVAKIYSKADSVAREKICQNIQCDPNKPNVLIFGNCWADAPNGAGTSFYTDYQDLLDKIVEIATPITDCNWIFRPHPAEYMYGDKVRMRALLGDDLPDHFFLWPDTLPGNAVVDVADCIVTALGTSGIEYTALGKPVLVARPSHYTNWGIGTCANGYDDFKKKLSRAWVLPKPTEEQIDDAYRFFALLFTTPEHTQLGYKYRWASTSWNIWPSVPGFIADSRTQIENEIAMIRDWLGSDIFSYNTFKWLNNEAWERDTHVRT